MSEISGLTWGLTIGLVVVLLAVDLILAALRPHKVGFKEATAWSVFYIAVAIAFGVWFTVTYGSTLGTEYFAGYIVEKSLSVDNLFVFVLVFVVDQPLPVAQLEKTRVQFPVGRFFQRVVHDFYAQFLHQIVLLRDLSPQQSVFALDLSDAVLQDGPRLSSPLLSLSPITKIKTLRGN